MNVINWILLFCLHCTDFVRMHFCPYSYKLESELDGSNYSSSLGSCGMFSASHHWGTSSWCTQAEGLDDCHDLPGVGRSLSYLSSVSHPSLTIFSSLPGPEPASLSLLDLDSFADVKVTVRNC